MDKAKPVNVLAVLRDLAAKAAKGDARKVGNHYVSPWSWTSPPFDPACSRPAGTYAVMRVETASNAVVVADFPTQEQAEKEAARLNGANESDAAIAAAAELLAADREYDAAKDALAEAKREKGNWRVNPLSHNHPAVIRMRAANERRAAALAAFGDAR